MTPSKKDMPKPAVDFRHLQRRRTLQLIEKIWDSIVEETEGVADRPHPR